MRPREDRRMAGGRQRHNLRIGATLLGLVAALAFGQAALENRAAAEARDAVQAPRFEVDPLWPKPLPNHWLLGSTVGVSVDARDHVFVVHRGAGTLNERTEIGAAGWPPPRPGSRLPAAPTPPVGS